MTIEDLKRRYSEPRHIQQSDRDHAKALIGRVINDPTHPYSAGKEEAINDMTFLHVIAYNKTWCGGGEIYTSSGVAQR